MCRTMVKPMSRSISLVTHLVYISFCFSFNIMHAVTCRVSLHIYICIYIYRNSRAHASLYVYIYMCVWWLTKCNESQGTRTVTSHSIIYLNAILYGSHSFYICVLNICTYVEKNIRFYLRGLLNVFIIYIRSERLIRWLIQLLN